jgi:Ca2+-binding RTX toxin-like protein
VATFTDSNLGDLASGLTASINWGDGTISVGTVSGSNGAFAVSGAHTYADEGSDVVGVTVTRTADNTQTAATGNVTVAEHDVLTPHGTAINANPNQLFNGTVASFTDTDTSSVAGDFTASINWGDGTISVGIVSGSNGSFAVSGSHTYASSGQDAVTVTLTDDSPGTATATANSSAVVGTTNQTGGNGNQVLDGSLGNQTLIGGNGADVLIGGPNDILTGGNGPDTFVFKPGLGRNTITDFNPQNELIEFDHHVFAKVQDILSHVSSDGHGNTLITAGANDVVTLLGVAPSSLHAADFHII